MQNTGTLTVTSCTLSGNTAYFGGGIANFGTATVSKSTLSDNFARVDGGGVINNSLATFNSCTLTGNFALQDGGGINNQPGGVLTLSGSTLSGNGANNGGGIFNQSQLTVEDHSNVSGNHAGIGADLLEDVSGGASLSIVNSTISLIDFA
jgi:hypothetical protein